MSKLQYMLIVPDTEPRADSFVVTGNLVRTRPWKGFDFEFDQFVACVALALLQRGPSLKYKFQMNGLRSHFGIHGGSTLSLSSRPLWLGIQTNVIE